MINPQQKEFKSENELRSYLVSYVWEYAETMNRIAMEIFLKQEAGDTSDLFEEYKQKYLPVFRLIVQIRKEPMVDKPVLSVVQPDLMGRL